MTQLIEQLRASGPLEMHLDRVGPGLKRAFGSWSIELYSYRLDFHVRAYAEVETTPGDWHSQEEEFLSDKVIFIRDLKVFDAQGKEMFDHPEDLEEELVKKFILL